MLRAGMGLFSSDPEKGGDDGGQDSNATYTLWEGDDSGEDVLDDCCPEFRLESHPSGCCLKVLCQLEAADHRLAGMLCSWTLLQLHGNAPWLFVQCSARYRLHSFQCF